MKSGISLNRIAVRGSVWLLLCVHNLEIWYGRDRWRRFPRSPSIHGPSSSEPDAPTKMLSGLMSGSRLWRDVISDTSGVFLGSSEDRFSGGGSRHC
jgi:hypothetical protein